MDNRRSKLWLAGLLILSILSVYLAFVGVWLGLWLWTSSVTVLTSIVVGLSVGLSALIVCYGGYLTYKKKQTKNLLLSLMIAGIIFMVLGAIVFVPYTKSYTYKTVSSYDFTYAITSGEDINEHPATLNGTLIEQTLPPQSSRMYFLEGWVFWCNSSVYQIEFSHQGKINFVMTAPAYYLPNRIIFNVTYGSFGNDTRWSTLFWTPPDKYTLTRLTFVFTNLENQSKPLYFRMTEFSREDSISPSVTNYRSLVDPSLAYAGLLMICVATVIGADFLPGLRTKEKNSSVV